jgi:RimJ/RimL family protein N-acetyltransferase
VGDLAPTIAGRLVTVEPLALAHEEGLWRAAGDRDVWRWMHYWAAESRERFRGWLEDTLAATAAGTESAFCVRDASTGAPLGSTRYLALRPEHHGLEIGWTWLARGAWGTGANTETKLLLLEHAFGELGCIRVEFKTDARNERARAALAALPARFEGVFRKHMVVRGGELRDSAWYSILDNEWPEVRRGLEARVEARAGRRQPPLR